MTSSYQSARAKKHTEPERYDYPLNGYLFWPTEYAGFGASEMRDGWLNCQGGSLASIDWYTGSPIGHLNAKGKWAGYADTFRVVSSNTPAWNMVSR
jgi:hypothetical protein